MEKRGNCECHGSHLIHDGRFIGWVVCKGYESSYEGLLGFMRVNDFVGLRHNPPLPGADGGVDLNRVAVHNLAPLHAVHRSLGIRVHLRVHVSLQIIRVGVGPVLLLFILFVWLRA